MLAADETRPLLSDSSAQVFRPSRLWRNACVLNLAAVLTFSGATALTSIQSSLNSDQGLGVAYLAVTSAFCMVGALLSGVAIRALGCKWTLVLSPLGTAICASSNFYPTWGTFIPAGIVNGLLGGFLVVTQRVYTAQLGHLHSDVTEKISTGVDVSNDVLVRGAPDRSRTQGRFFLFFVATYKLAYVTGNFASSMILGTDDDISPANVTQPLSSSVWFNQSLEEARQCGAGYCNEDLKSDFRYAQDKEKERIYILIGFCVGVSLLSSALVALFLDNLDKLSGNHFAGGSVKEAQPSSLTSLCTAFKSTIALHKNMRLLLLVPSAFTLMAIDSFWMADFSKAFVTCPMGMHIIGYVMLWMGVTATLASGAFGWMTTRLLRRGPLIMAPLLQIGLALGLLYWTPDESSLVALCSYTAAWCLCSGVRHSIFPALVGIVFRDKLELAFSNILMWGAVGNVVIFIWSNWLCMYIKIYLIIAMLGFSLISYVALEILLEVDRERLLRNEKNDNVFSTHD